MSLFNKKRVESPPTILEPEVNFNSVVEYCEGLSKSDYDKLLKVVNIYRNANKDVCNVLGIKDEPSHAIAKETKEEAQADIPFIMDDVPTTKKKLAKK